MNDFWNEGEGIMGTSGLLKIGGGGGGRGNPITSAVGGGGEGDVTPHPSRFIRA